MTDVRTSPEATADVLSEQAPSTKNSLITVAVCILVTVLEGIDIQSIGVAAPRLVQEFGLSDVAASFTFSASLIGLLFGSIFGGWLSDRIQRKFVLAGSVFIFGIFSLSTTFAWDVQSLIISRFLTGLGLGGAMPNIIAIVSENTPLRWRKSLTMLVWIGTPAGGMIAAQIAARSAEWRDIFYAGGFGPLIMTPIILILLPNSPIFSQRSTQSVPVPASRPAELFINGRATTTILLWIAFFTSLILLHLLLNWLPLLIQGLGFAKTVAASAATWFNIGGCVGTLVLAALLRIFPLRPFLFIIYAGMALGFMGLSSIGSDISYALVITAIAGFFVIGGQFVLYGIVPSFYPSAILGMGVGSAIGAGRLGSIFGPLVVGIALSSGFTIIQLLIGLIPVAMLAGAAIIGAQTMANRRQNDAHLIET